MSAVAHKDEVGKAGEELAAQTLARQGYTIVDRNWRGKNGEIDIVAIESDVLAFIEVKTRSSHRYGPPAAAVSLEKLARLRRLAGQWLTERRGHVDARFAEIRLDVVAVTMPACGQNTVELLRGVS